MRGRLRWTASALLALGLVGSCTGDGAETILSLDGTGTVTGVVFLDRNGNGQLEPTVDLLTRKLDLTLRIRGTSRSVARTTTDDVGAFVFRLIPTGRYEIDVDTLPLADSVRVLRVDPGEITVSAADTAVAVVSLGQRLASIAAARSQTVGRRVAIEGVLANGWSTFSDSSLYVTSGSEAVRVLQVPPMTVTAGDSVRVLGSMDVRDGQPAIITPSVYVLGRAAVPAAVRVPTVVAARASGGRLDAAVVEVGDATVLEITTLSPGQVRLVVDDGSGKLEVLLPSLTGIRSDVPLVVGMVVDVNGLLSPVGGGVWRLRVRASGDLTGRVRTIPVADARARPTGTRVAIDGLVANAWAAFGDSTLYLTDRRDAIRVLQVPPIAIAAGDSVRIFGTLDLVDGQPALIAPVATVLGRGTLPAPARVATSAAARAGGGSLDAALVEVRDATVTEVTVLSPGQVRVMVDDGSGRLEVSLPGLTGIRSDTPLMVGMVVDVVGVLSPLGGDVWRLRARASGDMTARVRPISVGSARALPAGARVILEAVSANAWATFGDSSLYVSDATDAIRVLQVPPIAVAAGDSVRVFGTLELRDGQPAVVSPTVSVIGKSSVRAAVPLLAATAAQASGGKLDAATVQVKNATILSVTTLSPGVIRLSVSDASGRLEILVYGLPAAGTDPPLVPGVVIDATGVLSPIGGGVWRLRMRAGPDLVTRVGTISVAEARRSPPGQVVALQGIALNGWATFGTATVHLADPTGAFRVLQVPPTFLFAGDSVRIVGTIGFLNGQRVLLALPGATPTLQGKGVLPPPLQVTTAVAATANQELLDAALVSVQRAVVSANAALPGGGRLLTVDDGSGPLQIQIDLATGINGSAYVVGTSLDVTGLLVPAAEGANWVLKPRTRDDIVVRT